MKDIRFLIHSYIKEALNNGAKRLTIAPYLVTLVVTLSDVQLINMIANTQPCTVTVG